MLIKNFRHWLPKVTELSSAQREQALEKLGQEHPPEDPIGSVVKAAPVCPRCHHRPCGRWGQAHGLPRYRCGACHKTFNPLTGTPLARLRHRERWPTYAQALIDGATVRQGARRCEFTKTPLFAGVTGSWCGQPKCSRRGCKASWKPTRRISSNRTKASAS